MCSWCWGISPALHELEQRAKQRGIAFRIVVGGLRPGGGDEWNEQFTSFLQHHWEEIHQRTGQPFNYALLQRDSFNYDTEPSCRAVVAARTLDPNAEHLFFELVQHHFYVQNQDPNQVDFYAPICTKLDLDFDAFKALFESEEIKKRTQSEFAINRQWGVRGYPTVLLHTCWREAMQAVRRCGSGWKLCCRWSRKPDSPILEVGLFSGRVKL
jgi:putative protein-disulfide isomerase